MYSTSELKTAAGPALNSLFDRTSGVVAAHLGISSLAHRSALLILASEGKIRPGSVLALYDGIAHNWSQALRLGRGSPSQANWRWWVPQVDIAAHNISPEVVLERAIVRACVSTGRTDLANQIPVASGIAGPHAERRRAIDLVQKRSEGSFAFIELKIASDNPLYAAFEIIGYVCVWLLARQITSSGPLLEASKVETEVLAPRRYYSRYSLAGIEAQLHAELAALGERHGVELSFAYRALPSWFEPVPSYADAVALALIDGSEPL